MNTLLVQEYCKNPVNNFVMDNHDVSFTVGNNLCDDDIVIYLSIQDAVVQSYSFAGNPSMITKAAASLLADMIEGESFSEVLSWDFTTFVQWGFVVSPRRKRSVVTALLAVQNAILQQTGEQSLRTYEDLLPDDME